MTGRELLALLRPEIQMAAQYPWSEFPLDALDGCVLLTADEAAKVREAFDTDLNMRLERAKALALLDRLRADQAALREAGDALADAGGPRERVAAKRAWRAVSGAATGSDQP